VLKAYIVAKLREIAIAFSMYFSMSELFRFKAAILSTIRDGNGGKFLG